MLVRANICNYNQLNSIITYKNNKEIFVNNF